MKTKVAKKAESIGGLSLFACTLFARRAKKEEEAKQNTHENHTAEHNQKAEVAGTRKAAKISINWVWLSEGRAERS